MLDVENTVTEMKRAFDGLISRMDVVEKDILSQRIGQQNPPKPKAKNKIRKKKIQRIQALWDNRKHICAGISQKEKRENGTEHMFETIMTENLPMTDTKPQIQEAQKTPCRVNAKNFMLRHRQKIEDKEIFLKEAGGKNTICL